MARSEVNRIPMNSRRARPGPRGGVKSAPSGNVENLEELFEHMLQDVLYAENKIIKTLPQMERKAESPELKKALKSHLEETREQVGTVKEVIRMMGYRQKREANEALEGLVAEGEQLAEACAPGPVRDSAIIAAAQKVEHYEIAAYGTLCAIAKKLGQRDAARMLNGILAEEKETDRKLSRLSGDIEEAALRLVA